MKQMVLRVFSLFLALWATRFIAETTVYAHESGSAYVLVNDQYVLANPILNIAQPSGFEVGEDIASGSGYVVGKQIEFSVDEEIFPNPYQQAQSPFGLPVTNVAQEPKPQFRWDFRDGSPTEEGSRVIHVFTKPGTYIVELSAKFEGKAQEFSEVNTIQLDVLPQATYTRPVPNIVVNGVQVVDGQRDVVNIKPAVPVSFDAAKSQGDIAEYLWDFGDTKGAKGKTVTHRYSRDEYFPVVVLRVVDVNNVAVDTYALLNMPFEKPNFLMKLWYSVSDFVTGLFYRE